MLGNCFRSWSIPLSRAGVDCRGRELLFRGPDPGKITPPQGVWRVVAVLPSEVMSAEAMTAQNLWKYKPLQLACDNAEWRPRFLVSASAKNASDFLRIAASIERWNGNMETCDDLIC